MGKKKTASHRQPLRRKYNIAKRAKEDKRKARKALNRGEGGAHKHLGPKKKKGLMLIPNSWPFKEALLGEMENAKRRMEERQQRQKETRAEDRQRRRMEALKALTGETEDAAGEDIGGEQEIEVEDSTAEQTGTGALTAAAAAVAGGPMGQQSRRAYLRALNAVIAESDVILQVLDARDPQGCRSRALEEGVLANQQDKKLVLVLNKVDLVPRDVVLQWMSVLRVDFPTVAFKACTQEGGKRVAGGGGARLGRKAGDASKVDERQLQQSASVGTEQLMNVLKNYCRSFGMKTSIVVGVVGCPNVGKSSLINSLRRSRAAAVSSQAGFTKGVQEVILDKNIRMLDSPGVVLRDGSDPVDAVLRNCVNPEQLDDPIGVVQALLTKAPPQQLMEVYEIGRFDASDAHSFLAQIARRLGKLKRGGVPNIEAAAIAVIRDWNAGRIPFYTIPDEAAVAQAADIEARRASGAPEEGVLDDGFAPSLYVFEDPEEPDAEAGDPTSTAAQPMTVADEATSEAVLEAPPTGKSNRRKRNSRATRSSASAAAAAAAATPADVDEAYDFGAFK